MKPMLLCLAALLFAVAPASAAEDAKEQTITCDPATPCWICDASLREKGRMWCKEHDRYEDRCWICHPEMRDKTRLYCGEHGIYEDECTLCHPELAGAEAAGKQQAAGAAAPQCGAHGIAEAQCILCTPAAREKGRLWCKEHARYEDRCWLCHPDMKEDGRAYCEEHHLYEDECIYCKPGAAPDADGAEPKAAAPKPAGPPCETHGIAEQACFLCNPEARQKGRLWCKEHARYEDRCWLCHPDIQEEGRAYCEEHYLYEDECIYCNPALLNKAGGKDKHSHLAPGNRLECREHAVWEDECAICHPELAPDLAAGEDLKIRFASKESAGKAGVDTATPVPVTGGQTRTAYAELGYNKNRLAMITPLTGGVITSVRVDVGEEVAAGSILAELTSNEVAEAKRRYLEARLERMLATQEHERQQALGAERIAAQRDVQAAQTAVARATLTASAAKQALINLGLSEAEVTAIAESNDTSATLVVRAPFAGTITERTAVQGSAVKAGDSLLQLADLSTMWIELSVSEEALQELQVGQAIEARFPALGNSPIHGTLSWIATTVDNRSRLIKARAVVTNPGKQLRAGLYGEASISTSAPTSGMGVPRSSIQRLDRQPFVFVRETDDLYLARRVDLGPRIGEHYLVTGGLTANDPVVVTGTHVVFSEMMKSRLGAGCVDD